MRRDNERGAALVMALLALSALGLLAAAIAFTMQTETRSSANYKYGQGAYYVANAGVQRSLAWFNNSYTPSVTAYSGDPARPALQFGGQDVVLAGKAGVTSNYPDSATVTSFSAANGNQTLTGNSSNSGVYASNATLLRSTSGTFLNTTTFTSSVSTLERWRIDAFGWWRSAANPLGTSEVSAIIERTASPFWNQAVWVDTGATFGGNPVGSYVDAYDPSAGPYGPGNITNSAFGSNGDVTLSGYARIYGDLLYGPTGAFNDNVQAGWDSVTGEVSRLPAKRVFPPIPSFSAGTTDVSVGQYGSATIGPGTPTCSSNPCSYRSLNVSKFGNLSLTGGTYYIDGVTLNQGSTLTLAAGANVTLYIKSNLQFNQGSLVNPSYDPSLFQIYYASTTTATVSALSGTAGFYGVVYAPNAQLTLSGGSDFFGSFIAKSLQSTGGSGIHYDRGLQTRYLALRPYRIITWTQKTF